MSDLQQTIQEAIMAVYATITLPHSLGTPSTQKHEPKDGFDSDALPAVVVTRGIQTSNTPLSSTDKLIVREYIVDLNCYETQASDPVNETARNNTADCVDVVLQAFSLYGLDASGVMTHEITADTNDTEVYARDDTDNYIGVRFRHEVAYWLTTA
jgi:hypothetical protein